MYIAAFQNCNERSIIDSIDIRGPYATIEEAKEATEKWKKEYTPNSDYSWEGESDEWTLYDPECGAYIWTIQKPYKPEELRVH